MSTIRPRGKAGTSSPERLPLRWGFILVVAAAAGMIAFTIGGLLAAFGAAALVISTLHKILA